MSIIRMDGGIGEITPLWAGVKEASDIPVGSLQGLGDDTAAERMIVVVSCVGTGEAAVAKLAGVESDLGLADALAWRRWNRTRGPRTHQWRGWISWSWMGGRRVRRKGRRQQCQIWGRRRGRMGKVVMIRVNPKTQSRRIA